MVRSYSSSLEIHIYSFTLPYAVVAGSKALAGLLVKHEGKYLSFHCRTEKNWGKKRTKVNLQQLIITTQLSK